MALTVITNCWKVPSLEYCDGHIYHIHGPTFHVMYISIDIKSMSHFRVITNDLLIIQYNILLYSFVIIDMCTASVQTIYGTLFIISMPKEFGIKCGKN